MCCCEVNGLLLQTHKNSKLSGVNINDILFHHFGGPMFAWLLKHCQGTCPLTAFNHRPNLCLAFSLSKVFSMNFTVAYFTLCMWLCMYEADVHCVCLQILGEILLFFNHPILTLSIESEQASWNWSPWKQKGKHKIQYYMCPWQDQMCHHHNYKRCFCVCV